MDKNQSSSRVPPNGPGFVPWTCDQCGRSAYPGWVQITYSELSRFRTETEAWRERHPDTGHGVVATTADFRRNSPRVMRWEVICEDCSDSRSGTDSDDEFYSFATSQAATLGGLLHWCSHLHEKSWLADTNWSAVLRRLSAAAQAQ